MMNLDNIDNCEEDGAFGGNSPEFSKTVGRQITIGTDRKLFKQIITAQKKAMAAGDASVHGLLDMPATDLWPPTYQLSDRRTVEAEIHTPPEDKRSPQHSPVNRSTPMAIPGTKAVKATTTIPTDTERRVVEMVESLLGDNPAPESEARFNDQMAELNREIAELKSQLHYLQNGGIAAIETPDETNVRIIRTKMIVSEVSFDKKMKTKLELADIEDIQRRVEVKIHSDRTSTDNEVYQRNHALFHHLMRRKKYSKGAYEILKGFWIQLGVSGDLVNFTGQLFDREYLDPKSDKYYKYVSILTFMLKYQRMSKAHPKKWFKGTKEHDTDLYFFTNWQQIETDV